MFIVCYMLEKIVDTRGHLDEDKRGESKGGEIS